MDMVAIATTWIKLASFDTYTALQKAKPLQPLLYARMRHCILSPLTQQHTQHLGADSLWLLLTGRLTY